jgi:hypothetical protein
MPSNASKKKVKEWPDDELIKLGKEMVKFYKDDKDACFIQDFAIHIGMPSRKLYTLAERVLFTDYYEEAKDICAKRIAKGAGKPDGLNAAIAQRFLNAYFHDVKQVELDLIKSKKDAETQPTIIHYHGRSKPDDGV